MDYNYKTKQLTAKATEHSKLVTIQALVSIIGMSQSGSFLSLSLQDLTKDIQDPILRYFLKYLRYLDDLQTGVVAKEIVELQREVNLEDPDLNVQCQDYDCCKYEADLSPLLEICWEESHLRSKRNAQDTFFITQVLDQGCHTSSS